MSKKRSFYGWRMVAVFMVILGLMMSLRINLMSLFVLPVTQELGISRTQFSSIATLTSLVGMICAPIAGILFSRYSVRYIMTAAGVVCTLSYASFSLAQNIWHMAVSGIGLGIGYIFLANLPISILVNRWFLTNRGTVLSIAFAGGSLGGALLSPVVTYLIKTVGWRNTYSILGVSSCILIVPLVFFIIRNQPEDVNLKPLGENEQAGKERTIWGYSIRQLFRMPSFWMFTGGNAAMLLTLGCLYHMPVYAQDLGFSGEQSALIVSVYSIVAIGGKFLMGRAFDKFGLIYGILVGAVGMAFTFLFLLAAKNFTLLLAAAVCYGVGSACGTVMTPILLERMFGPAHYGENYGFAHAVVTMSMGINNPLFASIYDIGGSYAPAWMMGVGLCVLAVVLFFGAMKTLPQEAQAQQSQEA